MRIGPITSSCSPTWEDAAFAVESYEPARADETFEREPVPSTQNEDVAFDLEVARIQKIRKNEPGSAPVLVRLMAGDQEQRRRIV